VPLLTTCSTDSALAPRVPIQSDVDLTGLLLRAGGQVPIPLDQVLIELRRVTDSSVAYRETRSIADVSQAGGSLTMRVSFVLDHSPEDFHLYVEALGGGVLYYTARAGVTIRTGQTTRTSALTPVYVGPGATADEVQLTLSAGRVAPGDSVHATAVVLEDGTVVPGAPVGILSSDSPRVAARAEGLDKAWLVADPDASGSVTVTAVLPNGVTAQAPLDIGSSSAPFSVSAISPTSQNAVVNQLAGAPPSVQVLDDNGVAVPGVTVTFAVVSGSGTVSGATPPTDANGLATVASWRMGQVAGPNSLTATVVGVPPVTFTATAAATAVASLAKVSGDNQAANAGSGLPAPLVIEVRDTFSNVIPAATVGWTVTDGTIVPPSGPSDAQGRAQASWTLGLVQANPTATATVGTVVTSFAATAIPQTPTVQLGFAGVPGIGIGLTATVNVTLTRPVQLGTLAVALSSSNTGVFTVSLPDTVYIAQGQSTGSKVLSGISAGTATLTGTAPGYDPGTLTVVVQNRSISLPPTLDVPYDQTASLPIQLPAPAPASGVSFTVASSDPGFVGVQTPTVTIPAGGQAANATLMGVLPGHATITVSNPAYVSAASTVTTRASLNIVQSSANPNASFGTTITVNFESNGSPQAAPAPGIVVTLSPVDPGCVAATSPVTIPTGLDNVTSQLTYGGSANLPCTTLVRATAPDLQSDSLSVTVDPVPALTVRLSSTQVGQGLEDSGSITLGASNHGGSTITLRSADPAVVLLSPTAAGTGAATITLNVLPGMGTVGFYYQALEGVTGAVPLSATATGFASGAADVSVVQPAVELAGVPGTTTTLSPDISFSAQVGLPNGQRTGLSRVQNVRGRAPAPLVATITSGSPAVGTIVDSLSGPTGGAAGVARIPSGRSYTSTSGPASGGVAFHSLATGTSVLTVAIPGFLTMTANGNRSITVTQPVISVSASFAQVGQGLVESGSVSLSTGNHGGASVTVASRDPAVMLLSQTAAGPAAASITVPLANGEASFSYYLHALEGATGTTRIVASAPRYTADSVDVAAVVPGVELAGLPATTTTLSPNDIFYARIGVSNGQGTALSRVQNLRPGAPAELTATFTSGTPAVGTIVDSLNGPAGAASGTARIPVGRSSTSSSGPASGGAAFHPLSTGSTVVTVGIPGFTTMSGNGNRGITVSQPLINVAVSFAQIGGGLQESGSVSLNESNHGGASVTITSRDPAVALLSQTVNGPGAASITVPLANGQASFSYYVQAPEGATGSTRIVVTEPRFGADSVLVTAVAPGVELAGLPAATTTLSADDNFYAQIGVLNGQGTTLARVQSLRGGAPGELTAMVGSGTPEGGVVVDSLTRPLGAATGTARIRVGSSSTNGNGPASGGLAFHPLLSGSTVISVTIPGFTTARANGFRTVTISQPGITLGTSFPTVGRGLQETGSGQLGALNHGGVTVTLTSSDPAVLLLSKDATTPGTGSIQLAVANGSTGFSFYVQGVEGASGTPSITAVAAGFIDATTSQTVGQAAVELAGVLTPIEATAPDAPFFARIGIGNGQGTAVSRVQNVRAGAPAALVATFGSSNTDAGTLVDGTGPPGGTTRTAQIGPGSSSTPGSVAQGGVAFHPIAPGHTRLSVTIPGVLTVIKGSRLVTVNRGDEGAGRGEDGSKRGQGDERTGREE
jgi:hypothetical protein